LTDLLQKHGFKPGVISRGYGGDNATVRTVTAKSNAKLVGDEPVLIHKRTGCPVVVSRDRALAATTLLAEHDCDIILSDDNFATIISAIEEGRRQYNNIRKFVYYLLSSNFGEVIAICMALFIGGAMGGQLIFLPVQILWMNLVTDGITVIALGMEPSEKNNMQMPPRNPKENILQPASTIRIFILGSYIGLATFALFYFYQHSLSSDAVAMAQTLAFTAIVVIEKVNVLNFRSLNQPISRIGVFSNPWLLLALTISIGLQIAAVYTPFLQNALHTVALGWQEWALILLIAAPIFLINEIYKYYHQRRHAKK
jgi:Ca2+-transporting ATPase